MGGRKLLAFVVIWLVVIGAGAVAWKFLLEKRAPVAPGTELQVPFILWGGDVATFLANGGSETQPGSIFGNLFGEQKLKLKLTNGNDFDQQVKDYLADKSPFLRGTMSMLGEASERIGKDEKTKPVVFLQLTWSKGDHLVSQGTGKTIDSLKGKKIALQEGGPHWGMLDDILTTARLSWSDITPVPTKDLTGEKGPAKLFKDNKVDACFCITPDMDELTGGLDKIGTGNGGADKTVKGAFVLISTNVMQRSIADVYACRKDFFDANKELVEKFAAGYLQATEQLVDMKKKNDAKDTQAAAKYQPVLKMAKTIFNDDLIKTEDDADGLIGDAMFVGLPGNYAFFAGKGNLSGFDAKMGEALNLAVKLKKAAQKINFLNADLDYDKLKSIGTLKTDKDALPPTIADKKREIAKDVDLSGDTIYSFSVDNIPPKESGFPPELYEDKFKRIVEQASLFGKANIVVRGHVDNFSFFKSFTGVGIKTGNIRQEGDDENAQYSLIKDGKSELLNLKDTRRVLHLIENEPWTEKPYISDDGKKITDLRKGLKDALQISKERAEAGRNAIITYAKEKGIRLDEGQIRFQGMGLTDPAVAMPRNDAERGQNRRIEFRLIRAGNQKLTDSDFDF